MTDQTPTGQELGGAERGAGADVVAGVLAAAVGVAVLLYVRTFPEMPGGQPGPALFPGIVGALFVLFGTVLAVRALVTRHAADAAALPGSAASGRVNAVAVIAFVVLYILLVETLGFVITMGGLLLLLMWRLGARLWVAAVAAAVTTGVMVLIFQRVLLVPLPSGLLPAGFLV